jgi:hypothetical protein
LQAKSQWQFPSVERFYSAVCFPQRFSIGSCVTMRYLMPNMSPEPPLALAVPLSQFASQVGCT